MYSNMGYIIAAQIALKVLTELKEKLQWFSILFTKIFNRSVEQLYKQILKKWNETILYCFKA